MNWLHSTFYFQKERRGCLRLADCSYQFLRSSGANKFLLHVDNNMFFAVKTFLIRNFKTVIRNSIIKTFWKRLMGCKFPFDFILNEKFSFKLIKIVDNYRKETNLHLAIAYQELSAYCIVELGKIL